MDYCDGQGRDLIRQWYEGQVPAVKAAVRWAVREVAGTRELSENPTFNRLVRQHVGLFTLRVSVNIGSRKRQFRAIGFSSLNANELVLAGGCEKSGRFTIPPGVYDDVLDAQLRYYLHGVGALAQTSL